MEGVRKKLACEVLVDLDGAGPGPLHERLTRQLRTAIRNGVLTADSPLPPSRALAADLGCSRWVVTQAYEQLVAEGYLTARTGSATRVRRVESDTARRRPTRTTRRTSTQDSWVRYDLAPGLPDLREFPRRQWAETVRSRLSTLPYTELGYVPEHGLPALREGLAGYLRRVRGADAAAADITITSSVTAGVTRLCALLRAEGVRRIAVEDPGWTRLRDAIARTGLEIVGIPVDDHGLVVHALDDRPDVRAVLVTPAHQFPTGVVLAPERRTALLAWARRVDGLVLEDDYDAEFRYDRRPIGTVQGADPSRVALFGSLSKTLSPAIGLGWMATPPRWTEADRAAQPVPSPPSGLEQLAFTAFLGTGGYDRHLRSGRQRYRRRRDALVAALAERLPHCSISGIAAGLHLVLHLPTGTSAARVVETAAEAGVRVADLDGYRSSPDPADPALVLGYGNLPDSSVETAVELLAKAIAG
ncbi:MAG TPA: PLP-dependent aminotransferase family protein [Actinopolymorphaceae bacterium]